MERILNLIASRSQQLSANPFCQWILEQNDQQTIPQQFSFSPSMLYFIISFKDILEHLSYSNPQNEIEKMINVHCDEDKNHWMWYLSDLNTLGYEQALNKNNWEGLVRNIWSDANKPSRDLVYLIIHEVKKHQSPIASLAIIECIESTFGVFMSTLKKRYNTHPHYAELLYFGQNHEEQEMNHSLGHWIDQYDENAVQMNHDHFLKTIELKNEEYVQISKTIHNIYDQFEIVFRSWLANKDLYKSTHQKHSDLRI